MKKIFLRILLVLTALITVIFYIGPVITTGEMNIGIITGFAFAALCLVWALLFDKINRAVGKFSRLKKGKIILGAIAVIAAAAVGVAGITFINIAASSHASKETSDVAIVLGCKVNGDKPGPFLKGRINAAFRYLSENPSAKAVLSGGQGNGENISEAQCMYNALTEKGISADRLYIEDKSTSTYENFKNSAEIIEQNSLNAEKITVITNDFHEYRAKKFAERCGFTPLSYPSKTPWNGYMPFSTREIFAVVYQIYLKM